MILRLESSIFQFNIKFFRVSLGFLGASPNFLRNAINSHAFTSIQITVFYIPIIDAKLNRYKIYRKIISETILMRISGKCNKCGGFRFVAFFI